MLVVRVHSLPPYRIGEMNIISCYEREVGGLIPSCGAKFMEVWQSLVYCTCLENRRTEMFREFESHRFRQFYNWSVGRMVMQLIANQ